MMKSQWEIVFSLFLGVIILCAAIIFIGRMACRGEIMDNTKYTPGYSHQSFQSIKIGMTKAQVQALLGPPFKTVTSQNFGWEGWHYSSSGRFGWRQKIVWFDKQIVIQTVDKWDDPE
jgi:outer membrane protein assembly factor BamE (lipoprotein component of BamABCDE complex)